MRHKHKGTSRVPATEKAHDFWFEPCNRDAAALIEPLVSEMRRSWVSWAGVQFSDLLTELYSDPTTVARWERLETDEDYKRLAAFKKMCRLMAHSIEASRPGRQINVVIPKGDHRAGSRGDEERQVAPFTVEDSKFRIADGVASMEAAGCGRDEAISKTADSLMFPENRVREAVEYAQGRPSRAG